MPSSATSTRRLRFCCVQKTSKRIVGGPVAGKKFSARLFYICYKIVVHVPDASVGRPRVRRRDRFGGGGSRTCRQGQRRSLVRPRPLSRRLDLDVRSRHPEGRARRSHVEHG